MEPTLVGCLPWRTACEEAGGFPWTCDPTDLLEADGRAGVTRFSEEASRRERGGQASDADISWRHSIGLESLGLARRLRGGSAAEAPGGVVLLGTLQRRRHSTASALRVGVGVRGWR